MHSDGLANWLLSMQETEPSPNLFPYIGAKAHLAPAINAILPGHDTFIDVFGGSAAVLLAHPAAGTEIFNDINGDIVNFMLCLRDNMPTLLWKLTFTPVARDIYYQWLNDWRAGHVPEDRVERAARWYFLQCISFSGKFGGGFGAEGHSGSAAGYQSRLSHLLATAKRLARVTIENADFETVVRRYDCETAVIYGDPPYEGVVAHTKERTLYWGTAFGEEEHIRLAKLIHEVRGKAIISYYHTPQIDKLYQDFHCLEIPAVSTASKGNRDSKVECLFTNYEPLPLFRSAKATVGEQCP